MRLTSRHNLARRLALWQRHTASAEAEILRLKIALRKVYDSASRTPVTPTRQTEILRAASDGLRQLYKPKAYRHRGPTT